MSWLHENDAERVEWFNALKPGDEVLFEGNARGQIVKVQNRTPGGKIRLENGTLFEAKCSTYKPRSNGWGTTYIIGPITPEFIELEERRALESRLGTTRFSTMSLETLRELDAVLDRPKGLKEFTFETSEIVTLGEIVLHRVISPNVQRPLWEDKRILVHKVLSVFPHTDLSRDPSMTVTILGEEVL